MRHPCDKIQGEHISGGECPYCRIEQLENDRTEVFDLAHTIALANIDDRLIDPLKRIAKLSEALEDGR